MYIQAGTQFRWPDACRCAVNVLKPITMAHIGKNLKQLVCAALLGIGSIVSSCGTQQTTDGRMDAPAERDIDQRGTEAPGTDATTMEERKATIDRLEDIHDRINSRMDDVDARMEDTTDQARLDELRAHRFELEKRRAQVNDQIRNIEVSDQSTWENVRQEADATAQEVGDWFDTQAERIDRLFEDDGDMQIED